MKTCGKFFLVVSLLVVPIYAQKQSDIGLILRGQLSDGKARHEKGKVIWSGKLIMEFENTGDQPIILINPNYAFGTGLSRVEFVFQKSGTSKEGEEESVGWVKDITPTEAQADALKYSVGLFDTPKPPDNLTLILSPGSKLTFEENFEYEQKYLFKERNDAQMRNDPVFIWEDAAASYKDDGNWPYQSGLGLGDARFMKLTYRYTLAKFTSVAPDFLEKLASRWSPSGRIPVNESGDYFLIAEPISIQRKFEKVDWPKDTRTGLKFFFPWYVF